ncbi:inner membrane protein YhjD [Mycobacterium sp.]|uniref:inner membrane protein YhjD n=1 Tax=Mycobacterium sp. TaxID=1785 RepID=UPI002BCD58F5|nr:inner membrane protein YhjD [Mycobacterium sp.]HME47477.1 inner membrane protein YhjD [Mycobacterium sp.]
MPESKKPGLLDRLRARYGWFDHVIRAVERYNDCHGTFFAAGITYFTVFALFPLLMVGFAAVGFVLSHQPHVLAEIDSRIKDTVTGDFGQQLVNLMDAAIDSRTSLGIVGLATALWAGLGWMANLRKALSAMWDQPTRSRNFITTKLSDLGALLSAFVAIVITLGLTALGDPALMARVLRWFGIHDVSGLSALLRVASLLVSVGVSWLVFTWMIARLPRVSVSFASSVRAALLAAIGFEVFKQFASIILRHVVHGPAGAVFGPILALMVFAYYTAQLVLLATAWAATSAENLAALPVQPPQPGVVVVRRREGVGVGEALAAMTVGALAALGISWARRR